MEAYAKSSTPKEEKDRRGTPWELVRATERALGLPIDVDACADADNAKAFRWWCSDDDALAIPWAERLMPKTVVWMNPPYSRPGVWCEKAVQEARAGLIVVGCLTDDRSTQWFQRWIEGVACVAYLPTRRIPFLGSDGRPQPGNPKASVLPVWTPWKSQHTDYVRLPVEVPHD